MQRCRECRIAIAKVAHANPDDFFNRVDPFSQNVTEVWTKIRRKLGTREDLLLNWCKRGSRECRNNARATATARRIAVCNFAPRLNRAKVQLSVIYRDEWVEWPLRIALRIKRKRVNPRKAIGTKDRAERKIWDFWKFIGWINPWSIKINLNRLSKDCDILEACRSGFLRRTGKFCTPCGSSLSARRAPRVTGSTSSCTRHPVA